MNCLTFSLLFGRLREISDFRRVVMIWIKLLTIAVLVGVLFLQGFSMAAGVSFVGILNMFLILAAIGGVGVDWFMQK